MVKWMAVSYSIFAAFLGRRKSLLKCLQNVYES